MDYHKNNTDLRAEKDQNQLRYRLKPINIPWFFCLVFVNPKHFI